MRNPLPEWLHPAARLIRGKPKTQDHGHAGRAAPRPRRHGPRRRTQPQLHGARDRGHVAGRRPVGGIGLAHATAAAVGVPLALLTGDERACRELTERDPSAPAVAVTYARDRFAAQLRPTDESHAAIEEATTAALGMRVAFSLTDQAPYC
ncbi:M55 family metallopeptidase [Streptomyces sp. NPDC018057]|uniref:M55 family metallopeptidase n=1 Tax=unclassified Streptomyces TaxID=2593676 RepID=UPI00378FDE64